MDLLITALHGAVLAVALLAAYEDVCFMRIRNVLVLIVVALFVPMVFLMPINDVIHHVLMALLVLAVSYALYYFRVWGGGDAKMIAALSLWPAPHDIPFFILAIAVAGGVLALVAIGMQKSGALPKLRLKFPAIFSCEQGWLESLSRGETVIPYGIAIAFATAVTLF